MKKLFLIALTLNFVSCASLSDSGKRVSIVKEVSQSCQELGDLSSGNLASKPSHSDVKNDLRNQTAELGGNTLIVDSLSAVPFGGYSGSGRAFTCKQI